MYYKARGSGFPVAEGVEVCGSEDVDGKGQSRSRVRRPVSANPGGCSESTMQRKTTAFRKLLVKWSIGETNRRNDFKSQKNKRKRSSNHSPRSKK